MNTINIENLTRKQVNEIISLVNQNGGNIYATRDEAILRIDLTKIKITQRLKLHKEIKKITKKETPHK